MATNRDDEYSFDSADMMMIGGAGLLGLVSGIAIGGFFPWRAATTPALPAGTRPAGATTGSPLQSSASLAVPILRPRTAFKVPQYARSSQPIFQQNHIFNCRQFLDMPDAQQGAASLSHQGWAFDAGTYDNTFETCINSVSSTDALAKGVRERESVGNDYGFASYMYLPLRRIGCGNWVNMDRAAKITALTAWARDFTSLWPASNYWQPNPSDADLRGWMGLNHYSENAQFTLLMYDDICQRTTSPSPGSWNSTAIVFLKNLGSTCRIWSTLTSQNKLATVRGWLQLPASVNPRDLDSGSDASLVRVIDQYCGLNPVPTGIVRTVGVKLV